MSPRAKAPCGTRSAYRRHKKYGEPLDELCAPLDPANRPKSEQRTGLPPRRKEVAVLAAQGLTSAQIAEKLVMSEHTVKTHLRLAFRDLGVSTRSELTARLHQLGAIPVLAGDMMSLAHEDYRLLISVALNLYRGRDEDARYLAERAVESLGLKTARPKGPPRRATPADARRASRA